MSLIEIDGHADGLKTLDSLALAVSTLSRAGVECHGVPIESGALYAMIAVQDRQANYALCLLKRKGFDVSADAHPATATLVSRRN